MALIKNVADAARLFPSFQNLDFLMVFFQFLEKYGLLCVEIEFYICILGLLITICHVFILTRKSIMTSSIISLMIGIGIYDALSMTFAISVKDLVLNFYRDECTPPLGLFGLILFLVLAHSRENMIRCSSWLGLLMALIRFLGLRFVTNPTIVKITKISFGFYASFITFLFSLVITMFNVFRAKLKEVGEWTPSEKCNLDPNVVHIAWTTQMSELYLANNSFILRVVTFTNAFCSKIIPSLLLPIFTLLLILEIRRARRKITNTSANVQKRTDKTTYLVIFMTVSFFIASLPAGIFYLFQVMYQDPGFLYLASLMDKFCNAILTINATLHGVICFVMSTDYRKTVKTISGIRPNKINTNSVLSDFKRVNKY